MNKKKIVMYIIILMFFILGGLIGAIFYNKARCIAYVNINIPSLIEESSHYTYCIYKKGKGKYTYKKVVTNMWINEVTSKKTVDSGTISNKEQLDMIQKDIEENYIPGYSNIEIYYENKKLNTLEDLKEKLF